MEGFMKISAKLLNIPPYISTAWKDISSLHTKKDDRGNPILVVTLKNQTEVEVPTLEETSINEIFETFARYNEAEKPAIKTGIDSPFVFSIPMKKTSPIESLGPSMTHNPEQANLPNLPPEMLEKVTNIAKAFGLDDTSLLPRPETNCNCLHCQIVRSLHGETPALTAPLEEAISEEDLQFRGWDIKQTDEKLYLVTNPLDENEHYTVFLGDPLGCTCGEKTCEHIRAVLSS